MEIKTERIEKTIYEEKKTYVANDGTAFKDMEECEKYEETAKCVINSMFKSVPQKHEYWFNTRFDLFCCDDEIYAVKIRDRDDLESLNKWLLQTFGDTGEEIALYDTDAIGTIQIFSVDEPDSSYWQCGSAEKLKETLCNIVDDYVASLTDKEGDAES